MKRGLLLFVDAVGVVIGLVLAAAVRFDANPPSVELTLIAWAAPSIVGGKILAILLFQCDRWSFRYAGASEMRRLLAALSLGSLMGWAVVYLAGPEGTSRAVLLLEPLFSLFILASYRFGMRVLPDRRPHREVHHQPGRPVLIVGAGEAGVMTLREIRRNPYSDMAVAGFIDDDPAKRGIWIEGVRVLGGREEIPAAVSALSVEELLIAIPSATGEQVRELVAACREVKTHFRIVPGLLSIIRGDVPFEQIRELRPEDLLGRETTEIDPERLAERVRGKRILVTGGGGSIGSELARQLLKAGAHTIIVDHSETAVYMITQELAELGHTGGSFRAHIADIRDADRVRRILEKEKPEMVFHAAACKHVPLMEENSVEAVSTNIFGTRNLIEASEAAGVERFLFISTDKAVRPTSMMGATKRAAELFLLGHPRRMTTVAVRFGNVFGSSGSVARLFMMQIASRRPVTVTHPHVVRYFMTVQEAVFLVIQAALMAEKSDLFVLEMGQPIRILDLARNMITLSGLRPDKDIPIIFTGLRPGEKLFEEVLTDGEHVSPSPVKKVFRISGESAAPADLAALLEKIKSAAAADDASAIRAAIREVVPEFTG